MISHFDPQPTLRGLTLLLRPLREDDFEGLHAAASDPLIWKLHPQSTRWRREVFEGFFRTAIESKGALIVLDGRSGEVLGTSRYYDPIPYETGSVRSGDLLALPPDAISIGSTFLVRSRWGGPANAEMKRLVLEHAFRWFDEVTFHVGADNLRSRRAMEKIGGELLTGVATFGGIEHVRFRVRRLT